MKFHSPTAIITGIVVVICCLWIYSQSTFCVLSSDEWNLRKTARLVKTIEEGCKLYKKDHGDFPPSGRNFETGPCVNALVRSGPKGRAYVEFREDEVVSWPISEKSHLRNPMKEGKIIRYRAGKDMVDVGCEDSIGNPEGFNNWDHRR